jgi:hypothetical protein
LQIKLLTINIMLNICVYLNTKLSIIYIRKQIHTRTYYTIYIYIYIYMCVCVCVCLCVCNKDTTDVFNILLFEISILCKSLGNSTNYSRLHV